MTGSGRMLLMFSVSSLVVLAQLEQELTNRPELTTGTSHDADTFILAVECPDTALAVWRVRTVVATCDPESTIRQQVLSPETCDRPDLLPSVEPTAGQRRSVTGSVLLVSQKADPDVVDEERGDREAVEYLVEAEVRR